MGFTYVLGLSSLLDSDCWKGIEFYKTFAEGEAGNTGVLRQMERPGEFNSPTIPPLPEGWQGALVIPQFGGPGLIVYNNLSLLGP